MSCKVLWLFYVLKSFAHGDEADKRMDVHTLWAFYIEHSPRVCSCWAKQVNRITRVQEVRYRLHKGIIHAPKSVSAHTARVNNDDCNAAKYIPGDKLVQPDLPVLICVRLCHNLVDFCPTSRPT